MFFRLYKFRPKIYEKLFLEKILELVKLEARKFHFPKYKKFFQNRVFFQKNIYEIFFKEKF